MQVNMMKKLTTLAVTATFVVVSQTAIIPNAQAFSFGSFSFSDSWGDSWGDGWGSGSRYYDPRWGRYPPPGYGGYGRNNASPWNRGFSGPHFFHPNRNGFGWGNRNTRRWHAPPQWYIAPGYYPPAAPPTPTPDPEVKPSK